MIKKLAHIWVGISITFQKIEYNRLSYSINASTTFNDWEANRVRASRPPSGSTVAPDVGRSGVLSSVSSRRRCTLTSRLT